MKTPLHLLAALTALAGAALSFRYSITGDGAWWLHVAERVLDGERLYRDVIDVNPPLIGWMSVPVILLERATGIGRLDLFPALVSLGALASLVACYLYSRHLFAGTDRPLFVAGLAVAFCILPLSQWGQREHLMLLLSTPYTLAVCARLRGEEPGGAIPAGIAAGLGFALKPHFLPAFAVLVAWEVVARRAVWRASVVAVATIAVYGLLVVLTTPYLSVAWGLREIYASYGVRSPGRIALDLRALLPAAALLVAVPPGPHRDVRRVFGVLTALWLALVIGQGKGFPYHYLPALGGGVLLVALGLVGRPRVGAVALAAIALLAVAAVRPRDPREGMFREVRAAAAGGPALIMTPYLRDVWPHVTYGDAEWRFPAPSAWPLRTIEPGPSIALGWMLPGIRRGMPVLVPLDTTRSALQLFLQFAAFREVWARYRETERGQYYRVFRPDDSSLLTVSRTGSPPGGR